MSGRDGTPLRLLACGDLHIGAGSDYGREPGDRLRDQQNTLAEIVQIANDRQVDAVLFAGDAFHRRRPTPAELLAFARPLAELEVPLVAITGNHDVEAADLPSALEVFTNNNSQESPGLLTLSSRPEIVTVGGIAVATLPWVPVGRLLAARDGGHDRAHEEAAAMLVAAARGLRAEIPAGTPAVLLGHWSVSGASTPTGAMTDDFREVVLDADELNELGFDAVVLGHIHKAADFNGALGWMEASTGRSGEPFFYTGSPLPVDFGEAKAAHGCWLLTIGSGGGEAEFIPIASRPFLTVDIDLTTGRHEEFNLDETDAVAAAIATHLPIDEAVVRIHYRATEEQARRIDWPKLRPVLDDAHRVFSITGDIVRSDRARVDGLNEDLAPLAAVDAWCDANDIPTERAADLVELSSRYLAEVGS